MKRIIETACLLAVIALTASCNDNSAYEYPYQNPKLSVDERVDNLISLLTPEEKIGLMMNGSVSVERLDIPGDYTAVVT